MTPAEALAELQWRLESDNEALLVLSAFDLRRWPRGVVEELAKQGILAEISAASEVVCESCYEGHREDVQTITGTDGTMHWVIRCPSLGRVELQGDERRRWRLTRAGTDYASAPPALSQAPDSDELAAASYVFRKTGEYWQLRYAGGPLVALKDAKGLRDIWELLRKPGEEIWAASLYGTVQSGGTAASLRSADGLAIDGGAGLPLADEETITAAKQAIDDFDERIETARDGGDIDEAMELADQRAKVTSYLGSVAGKGGVVRSTGSKRGNARTAVKNRIDDAIRKIGAHSPEMATHLARSIKTGLTISYEPETPLPWLLF